MRVYNTQTRKKEELIPGVPGEIRMYACGSTVYDYFHLGNARPLIVFDTLRRYLEFRGNRVTYILNFTDIDDKMIQRANREGITVAELGERFIAEFYRDADALGIRRATQNPRATDHIAEIITLIEGLIAKGHAYATEGGDVYFDVRSYPAYGKLSGQNIDDLENGARVDSTEDKRDPLDFALWKAQKPGEPAWDSPWGMGRPGWHIECSAMSMRYLGESFDIHAGGQDLIFPHHENEIAQSEAYTGRPFARYWMHNGYINIDSEKMSKSKGNFFTMREILKFYAPEVVRLFMHSVHYRNPINYSTDNMDQAKAALARLQTAQTRLADAPVGADTIRPSETVFLSDLNTLRARFVDEMDDDLNSAAALGVLFEMAHAINIFVSEPRSVAALTETKAIFGELCNVLGLLQSAAEEFPAAALALLEERKAAKQAKNWARADAIRSELKGLGYAVEDAPQGSKLKRSNK
ncbi:MAG: cysteine--tRNA ligase [Clostridiales bacterium]|nr:cysteine--tRNA ligase [Clostridiales bacterium]